MFLPKAIQSAIDALENAGFQAYAVGGCVRDALLRITPHDYDLCTDALPNEIRKVFADYPQLLAGEQHGTVSIVTDAGTVEITTFRKEGTYSDNRHPDWVEFVSDIREDLARRDFTVNAIAYSPRRGYADPFGGREDLENRILRAVGDPETRFREDSLRILRGMRFAARFRLTPEDETLRAMEACAPLTENLSGERIFEELSGFLPPADAGMLQSFAPILGRLIPELGATVGFDQRSPHHAYDVFTHTALVVEAVSADVTLRWAALLHDIGKVPTFHTDETGRGHFKKHANVGAQMADAILQRLKAPGKLREEVVWLIENHMTKLTPDRVSLRHMLTKYDAALLDKLICLQKADMASKGMGEDDRADQFAVLRMLLLQLETEGSCRSVKDLAVGGSDLMALGYHGPAIKACLSDLLERVLNEELPNEKEALLSAVPAPEKR